MPDRVKLTKHTIVCGRCGKKWEVGRYIYRIELHDLDIDEFRPFGTLAIDLCYQCNQEVKDFIFGKETEMKEIVETTKD